MKLGSQDLIPRGVGTHIPEDTRGHLFEPNDALLDSYLIVAYIIPGKDEKFHRSSLSAVTVRMIFLKPR